MFSSQLKDFGDATDKELIEQAEWIKERATELYNEGKYALAAKMYKKIENYMGKNGKSNKFSILLFMVWKCVKMVHHLSCVFVHRICGDRRSLDSVGYDDIHAFKSSIVLFENE